MQAVTTRLWQLLAVVVGATFLVGLLAGRFVFPHKSAKVQAIEAVIDSSNHFRSDESAAQSRVREVIPAIEAYNAHHGGYSGMTLSVLRQTYDATLRDVQVVRASRGDYCVQSTGSTTFHKAGPAGMIDSGPCSPYDTGAAHSLRAAMPALEAWNAEHGAYTGASLGNLRAKYDPSLSNVHVVRATSSSYCVETMNAPRYHMEGRSGVLPGPC